MFVSFVLFLFVWCFMGELLSSAPQVPSTPPCWHGLAGGEGAEKAQRKKEGVKERKKKEKRKRK